MPGDILRKRKIAVLGSRSVGKSSLVIQFVENQFVEPYYPTIETTFTKSISCKGTEFECDIIDTAGQDEYSIISSKHAIGIHGFVLVYNVASRNSFELVRIIYDKILSFTATPSVPCVVVGAKTDLKSRQVPSSEAESFAKSIGASWVETSAKTNANVGKVFENCLSEIEKHAHRNEGAPPATKCVIM